MVYNLIKVLIRKLAFIHHIDELKLLIWVYNKVRPKNYKTFKNILFIIYVLLFIVYFVSAFSALIILTIVTSSTQSLKFYLTYIPLGLLLMYLAYICVVPIQNRFFSAHNLVMFNLVAINKDRSYEQIRLKIPCLVYEIEKSYKKDEFRKIIVPYLNIIVEINLDNRIKDIKIFFKELYNIIRKGYNLELLDKVTKLDNKIKDSQIYSSIMKYIEATTHEKREDNLFFFSNKNL